MIFDHLFIFSILFFILSGGMAYYFLISKPESDRFQKRINSVSYSSRGGLKENSHFNLITKKETQLEKRLNRYLKKNNAGYGPIQLQLFRSGITARIEKLIGYFLVIWVVFFVAIDTFSQFNIVENALFALIGAALLSYGIIGYLEGKRRTKILTQLAPAIEIIQRGVKAGAQIDKTFQIVAREVESPLKDEFQQIIRELDFGADFEKVMHSTGVRVNIPDYYFFTSALVIQRRTGGSLSEILENIILSLNKTQEIRMKIKVFSSEAKTSGYVLCSLPFFVLLVLLKVKPEQVEFFRTDPLGIKLFLSALGLIAMAFFSIRRMIKIEE